MVNHKKLVKLFATAHFLIAYWVILSVTSDPISLETVLGWSKFILLGGLPIILLLLYILDILDLQGKAAGGLFLLYVSILLSALFAISTLLEPSLQSGYNFLFAQVVPWVVTTIGLITYGLYKLLQSLFKKLIVHL